MRHTRRELLKASGVALGGVGLAGCGGNGGGTDSAETTTPSGSGTDSGSAEVEASADTALAAGWNVMRARLHDAVTLSRAGDDAAAAALVGDVFGRFERASGEYGAHEGLESTSEHRYESFEGRLGDARSAFEGGASDEGIVALDGAGDDLLAVQRERTADAVADAFTLFVFGSRVRNVDALAAAGATDAAATVGRRVAADFERVDAHETLESTSQDAYEAFERALGDVVEAAAAGDAGGVHEAALAATSAVVDAAYERVPDAVAGVGHLSLFGAVGFDAEMATNLGGPGVGLAHAAGLDGYRVRVRDAAWLFEAGETAAAKTAARAIFRHFEGARAHEALEEAAPDAYEAFEHDGLESLVAAIEDGDGEAVAEAVETVHDGLTAGIETLAGEAAPVLESGYFRARLGDVRERYDRGEGEVAATVVENLFARFESNEADFHETLESTSEDLYHAFEEEHLAALPDALRAGEDDAVDAHLSGAADALAEFEASAGSTAAASAAASAYLTGRACDAGVLATLGDADRAETVARDAFGSFEAGANGFHEAVEHASEERYHAFEEAFGGVRSAAADDGDAYAAATAFADESTAAVYAVVGTGGSGEADAAALSTLLSDAFATFEDARVHEALEAGDRDAYETFESALSGYVAALENGEGVDAAAERYAQATRNAAFAVAGAVDEAPELATGDGDGGGDGNGGDGDSDLQGGPNVVEGVPDDADHVVAVNAVAFDPEELTVAAGDTVAWEWAAGEAHTVTAYGEEIPDGASYWATGGFDSEAAAREGWENGTGALTSGHAFVHTFETPGEHRYFCVPHEAAGMTGTVVVEE